MTKVSVRQLKRFKSFLAQAGMALLTLVLSSGGCAPAPPTPVTDEASAIKAAKGAYRSLYSKRPDDALSEKSIAMFEPYHAVLTGGTWQVTGTVPPDYRGTVVVAQVDKADGSDVIVTVRLPGKTDSEEKFQ